MNWRIVQAIFWKEMLDTLRDKRTLIMMVGVPLLLYPAIIIIGMQAGAHQARKMDEKVSRVAVLGESMDAIGAWVTQDEKIELLTVDDPMAALEAGDVEVVIEGIDHHRIPGDVIVLTLHYDSTATNSEVASSRVMRQLDDFEEELRNKRLKKMRVAPEYVFPVEVERANIAPPAQATGHHLSIMLSSLMMMMIALGAFYPAVDLTAGEKERGTFETLLSTPASKLEIITGKFVTVCLLALITGFLNLGSMALTASFVINQIQEMAEGKMDVAFEIAPVTVLVTLVIMIPLALLISAVMMSVAVFANSFKEAQNFLTPVFLLIVMPIMYAALPGVELEGINIYLPFVNVMLLFKELMIGKAGFAVVFPVFLSTAIFALMALLFATWLFQREEVVLSEEHGVPLTFNRKHFRPTSTPTPGMALGLFSIALLLLFYAGSMAQQADIIKGLIFTEWGLLFALVVGVLWFVKIDIPHTLNLRGTSIGNWISSILLGLGFIVLMIQFGLYNQKFMPEAADEMLEFMQTLHDMGQTPGGFALLIFAVAISPAVCEEVLFRGAILSGLRKRMKGPALCLVVGLLFGLMHISIYRIIPTGIMGVMLTYLVVRGGSIYLSILIHAINNGIAVCLMTGRVPAFTETWLNEDSIEANGLPMPLLVGAGILVVLGVIGMEWMARGKGKKEQRIEHG